MLVHDFVRGAKHCPDDVRGRIVDSLDGRRVAVVEVACALLGHEGHLVDVVRRVEQRQLINRGSPRMAEFDTAHEAFSFELGVENVMPVGTERVRVAETVVRDLTPLVYQHRWLHG